MEQKLTNLNQNNDMQSAKVNHSKEVTNKSLLAPIHTGVTTENLNLRKGAGTNYDIIITIPKGEELIILSQNEEWIEVEVDHQQGWVHCNWVEITNNNELIEPTHDYLELAMFDTMIASATSSYEINQVSRLHNIELAAQKVTGTILQPEDEFSFTNLVGPVTASNGYEEATVFVNGQLSEDLGGGMCQVSSTIYWAQLRAGILPIERQSHSRMVDYVPLGIDATMWEGSIDYRFKNTLDYPIYIEVTAKSGTLTVEFWSDSKALEGLVYEPRTTLVEETSTVVVYNTYLQTYKNGELVLEEYLHQSTYRIE